MADITNIYAYIDFRKFLSEAYNLRHARDKKFNKAFICKHIGMPNTRSYFNDIVEGRRNISNAKADLLAGAFELDGEESKYFWVLASFNQAVSREEKDFFFNQLVSLNRTPRKFITAKQYAYFSRWRHAAVRAALDVIDVGADYDRLAASINPGITARQAEESLRLLKSLRLIRKNDKGFWKPVDKNISPDAGLDGELIRQFQTECLDLGREVLLKRKTGFQSLTTKTISVSYSAMEKIMARIENLEKEVSSIVHKDEGRAEGIYHLNLHVFSKFKKPQD